ncbi:hypothetical protein BaRGS_00005661 [Batillaria attramentaria]|uniref:Uncharacterized protein n=1 Tax=Batillaria attramentaria TaxID=370345 RepID=A0ABD0LU31_9CAEN
MEDPDADCSRASLDLYIETLEENHGGIHQPHAQPSPVHVSSMSSFDLYADLDDSDEKMETDSTDVSDTNGNEKPSPSLQLQSSIDGDSSRTQEKGNVDWWVSAHRDLKEKYAVLEEKYATLNKNMMSLKALAMAKSSMASASKSVVTVTTGTSPVTITRCDAAVSTDTISHQGVGDCTVGGTNCNQQAVIHGDISGGEICSVTQSLPITHSPQLLSSLGSLQGLQLPDSTQSPLGSQPSGSSEKLESLQNSEDGCELPQGSQSQSPEYSHVQPKLLPGLQPPESTQAGSSHGSPNQGSSHGSPAQHLSHAAERSFEECGSSTHWSPRGPSSSGSLCSLPEGHTLGLLAQRPPQGSPSAMSAQGSQADLPAEGSHCSAANTFSPSPGSCGESLSPVSHHDSPATSNHSPPSSRDSSPVSRGSPGFSHCAETLQGSQLPPRSGQTSVVYTTEPKLSALPGVDMKDGGDSSSQAGVGCGNTLQDSAMHISEAVGFSRLNSKACVDMALKMDTSTNLEHIAAGVEHGHKADITDTVHIKSNYDINNDLSSSPTQSSSMVCSQPEGQTLALVMQHSGLPDLPLKVNIDKNADVDTVSDSRQQPGVSALHDEKEYMNASFPKSSSICNGQDANCTQKNKEVLEHVSPMSSKSTCEESADGGVIASNTQPPLSVCASVGGHNRTPSHPEAGETSPKLAPLRQSAAVLEGHAQKFGLRSSISLNCDVHKVPDQHDPFESDDTGILSPSPTHTVDRLSFEKTAASVPNTLGVGHAARTEMRAGSGSCTGKLNKKVRQQKAKPVNGDLAQSADSKPFLQDVEGKAWRAKLKLWPPGVCDVIRKPRPRVHGQQMDFVHNKWKSPTREYKSDLGCSETANVPSLKEVLPHCQLETGQHDKLSDSEKDKDADHLPKGGIAAESKDSPCELASSTRLDVGQTRSTDSKENRQKHSHSGQKETAKGSEQVPTKENKSCKTPLTHSDKVPPAAYPGVKSTSPENHPSTLSDYSSQKCVNFENSAEAMEQETPKLEISVQAAATVQASSEEMTTTVMKEELRSAEPLRKNPLSLFGTVEVSPVKDMAISSEGCAALSPADGKQLQHRLKPSIVPSLLWSPDKTLMSKPVLENPMSSRSYNAFLGLAECSVTMDDSNMLTAHSVGKDDTTTRIDTVDTQKGEVTFSGIVSEKSASDGLIHCPVTASQSIVDAGISGCDTKGDDDSSSYSNSQPMDFNSPLFGYPSHSVKLRGGSGFKFQRKHVAFASSSSTSLSSTTTSGCVSSTSLSSTSLTSQSPAAPPPQLAAIPSKVGSTRRRSLGFDVTVSPHDAVGDVNTHLAPVEKICAKECLPQQERVELGLHAGPADGDMTSSKPVALAQELEDGELENTSTLPGYAVGSSVSHTAPSVFDIIEQSLEEGELRSSDSFTNSFDKRCKLVSTSLKVSSPPQVLECAAGDNAQFADLKEVLKQKTQTISDVRKPSEKASSAHSRSHNTSPEVTDFKNTFEASGRSDTKLTVGSVPAHGSVASCLKACDVNEQARLAEKEPASCNRQTQQEEHVAFEGQPTNGAEWNQEDHSGDDKKCGPTTQTTLTAKRRLSSSSKDSPPSKRRHASSAFSLTQGNEHHGCDFGSVEDKTQKATNLHETASELSKRVSGSVCATVEKSGQVPNAALDEPDDEIVCVDSCEGTDQEDSVVDDGVCVSESELELPGCARTRVYRKFAAAGTVEMTEDGVADSDSGDMVEEDGGNDESSGEGSEGGDENGLDGSDHEAEEEDRETGDMADTSEDEEGRCSCDEMSDEEDNVPGEEMHPDEDEDNEDKENETPEEMREKIESDSEASDDEDSDAGVQAGDKRPTRCSHSGSEFEQSGSDIDGRDSHFPGGGRGEGQPLHQLQSHVTNREELLESEDEHSKLSDDLVLSSDSEHDEVFEREEMLENDLPSLEALGDPVAESSCRKLSGGGCEDSSTSGDLVPVASDTTFIIDDKGMGKGGDVLSSAGGNILTAVTPVVREGSHAGSFSQRPNWSMDCISLEAPEGSSLLVEHRDTSFHTSTSGRVFAAVASERLHDGDKQREERSKHQVHSQIATGCMLETDSATPETLVPAAKHSSRQSKSKQKSRKTSESAGGASKKRNCRVDGKDSSDRDKQVSISERLCKLSEGSVCSDSQRGPADRTDDPECSMNKRDARADQTEPGGSKNFGTRSKHAGRGSHAHEKHGSKSKESRKPAHALGRHHSDSRSGSRERSHTVHGVDHLKEAARSEIDMPAGDRLRTTGTVSMMDTEQIKVGVSTDQDILATGKTSTGTREVLTVVLIVTCHPTLGQPDVGRVARRGAKPLPLGIALTRQAHIGKGTDHQRKDILVLAVGKSSTVVTDLGPQFMVTPIENTDEQVRGTVTSKTGAGLAARAVTAAQGQGLP